MEPVPTIERVEADYPELGDYLQIIAFALAFPPSLLRQRVAAGLDRIGLETALQACRKWRAAGIFPRFQVETDSQVAAIWDSPFFKVVLEDGLLFYPPATADLTREIPPPCRDLADQAARTLPSLAGDSYWQYTLYQNFPEFYLEPFLAGATAQPLNGCDLACGWGRASLTLRDYHNRHLLCCDFTPANLDRLQALASRAGLGDKITAIRCDITALPFDDQSLDFFLAFDILEHLTNEALDRCLNEILRCGKPGAVLYTEAPLFSYCPALTHLQNFSYERLVRLLQSRSAYGRRFELLLYQPEIAHHFAFAIVAA